MRTENLSTLKIHKLSQAQYERELAAGNIDENALYLTPDVGGSGGSGGGHKELTQAEYNELSDEEKNSEIVYLISDAYDIGEAEQISYDNSTSGLSATNVQGAVDELNTTINTRLITDDNWNNVNEFITLMRKGGIMFVRGVSDSWKLTKNTYNAVYELSPELRPSIEIPFVAHNAGGTTTIIGRVSTAGVVSLYPNADTEYWSFLVSFPLV